MDKKRIKQLRTELEAERIDLSELAEIEAAFEKIPNSVLPDLRENAMAGDMLDELEAQLVRNTQPRLVTKQGPFATEEIAQAFAKGIDYANSFYGESGIDGPTVKGEPYQHGGQGPLYLDVEIPNPNL